MNVMNEMLNKTGNQTKGVGYMDVRQILKLGADAFCKSESSGVAASYISSTSIISALKELGGSQGFNISDVVANMQAQGLQGILESWLGDRDNQSISADQLVSLFGRSAISRFARELGVSENEAVGGLQDALPRIIDNASSPGGVLWPHSDTNLRYRKKSKFTG